ncbi:Serine/threonine protein kinase [Trema orientale]|uniref:Serine/threonine protein kinase n=1 Tax=Trema orientale TaxID=63057 RepID=A0A2P5DNK0_TREOI|nr:Serine/threonine protein kinase [Trema orientale]
MAGDWKVRYKIAIGVARGLHYLHEECRDCIIHCDIKPENILLDEDYSPKLADFGLAKLVGRDFSRVLTTIRGTIGYLAPEWISGIAITPKADVYSYGMVLFELVSGRRNCGEQLDEGMEHYFPFQVSNSLRLGKDLLPLLDCRLEGNANKEELNRACKVACWCIQDDEKNRPNMSQVVQILMGVTEVGLPPVPLFFQRLAGISTEATNDQEANSGSGLFSNIDQATTKYFSFST